jgi:hypothetical protein
LSITSSIYFESFAIVAASNRSLFLQSGVNIFYHKHSGRRRTNRNAAKIYCPLVIIAHAEPTLQNLAKADFAKTRAVVNTFDRPEVRILAKMLVLRAVLAKDAPDRERSDLK